MFTASLAAGCEGPLSTLDPVGPAAARIAALWWVMLAGATLILLGVMGAALLALWPRRAAGAPSAAMLIGGGLVFPFVTLVALLAASLFVQRALVDAPVRPWRVEAVAERWGWSFTYPEAPGVITRDLMHAPAATPIAVQVTSADVIHSFWIPRVAGKIDAIPGQTNRIDFLVAEPGAFLGPCAEYCGVGHAHMAFVLIVHPDAAAARAALTP